MGKKRRSNATTQHEPVKQAKQDHAIIDAHADKEEGLFDNLDEEMDPSLLDSVLQQMASDNDENDALPSDDELADDSDLELPESNNEFDVKDKEDNNSVPQGTKPKKSFRDHYMNDITVAFGSDLDKIRQEPNFNSVRLNILIDSLEAGVNIFSELEQEIILAEGEAA